MLKNNLDIKVLISFIILNILIFMYFYYFNSIFPLNFIDDIGKIIYNRSIIQSMEWNARVGETLSIIFLRFDKIYYNIFISIVHIIFINLVFFYSFTKLPKSYKDIFFIFIIFVLWVSIQSLFMFVELSLWVSGSLNHLFGNVLLLLVFIPYFYLFYNKNIINNKWIIFLLVPVVYFTSFMNSYVSVPIFLGMMGLSVLFYYLKNKRIPLWSINGIIFGIFGFVSVILFSSEIRSRKLIDMDENFFNLYPHRYKLSLFDINNVFHINNKLFLLFLILFVLFSLFLLYKKLLNFFINEKFIKISFLICLYLGIPLIFASKTDW
ncbi:MAG: DUF6056 family protein [Alphaproteobacteria bacterium]|jgi:hypothetical protein|nr:DUF6056 family protein [Alphaproteobacteria bacterium]